MLLSINCVVFLFDFILPTFSLKPFIYLMPPSLFYSQLTIWCLLAQGLPSHNGGHHLRDLSNLY